MKSINEKLEKPDLTDNQREKLTMKKNVIFDRQTRAVKQTNQTGMRCL